MTHLQHDVYSLADGGGVSVQLTPGLLVAAAGVALVVLMIAGVVAALAWRRVKRTAREHGDLLSNAGLTVLAEAGPARVREISQLQLDLRAGVARTLRAVDAATAHGNPVGELPLLCQRVETVAASLDAQLSLLRRERNEELVAAALPEARTRAQQVTAAAAQIRSIAAQSASALRDGQLAALAADLDVETAVLSTWRDTYLKLSPNGH
jgi:hypothetical protein